MKDKTSEEQKPLTQKALADAIASLEAMGDGVATPCACGGRARVLRWLAQPPYQFVGEFCAACGARMA